MKDDDDVDPDACMQTNRERKESAKFTARKVFTHTSTLTSHRHSSKVSPQVRVSITERNVAKLQIPGERRKSVPWSSDGPSSSKGKGKSQFHSRMKVRAASIEDDAGSREREEEANVVRMSAFAPEPNLEKIESLVLVFNNVLCSSVFFIFPQWGSPR